MFKVQRNIYRMLEIIAHGDIERNLLTVPGRLRMDLPGEGAVHLEIMGRGKKAGGRVYHLLDIGKELYLGDQRLRNPTWLVEIYPHEEVAVAVAYFCDPAGVAMGRRDAKDADPISNTELKRFVARLVGLRAHGRIKREDAA